MRMVSALRALLLLWRRGSVPRGDARRHAPATREAARRGAEIAGADTVLGGGLLILRGCAPRVPP